jgi:uncharacterized membrane protein YeaQ/YmgE (transglycosylase-associated protein family)
MATTVYVLWIGVLYLFLVGIASGWAAWMLLGKDKALAKNRRPNWAMLLVLGAIGSFIGGFGVSLLRGDGFAVRPSGLFASFLGAIAVTAVYLAAKRKN